MIEIVCKMSFKDTCISFLFIFQVLDVIEAIKFEDVFEHMQVELEIHGSASVSCTFVVLFCLKILQNVCKT